MLLLRLLQLLQLRALLLARLLVRMRLRLRVHPCLPCAVFVVCSHGFILLKVRRDTVSGTRCVSIRHGYR